MKTYAELDLRPLGPSGRQLAHDQAGLLTRQQLLRLGVSDDRVDAMVAAHRWRRLRGGLVLTHTGSVPPGVPHLTAAVLAAGSPVAVGLHCALWLADQRWTLPPQVQLVIPRNRHGVRLPGIRLYPRDLREDEVHVVQRLPTQTPASAVLTLWRSMRTTRDAVALLGDAARLGLCTPYEVLALAEGRRIPRRSLLEALAIKVSDGVHSPIELEHSRVMDAHGLPPAHRQRELQKGMWIDAGHDCPGGLLITELDGRHHAQATTRFRDMARDNRNTLSAAKTLRFGWDDLVDRPCEVAAMTATMLRQLGLGISPHPCGRPSCAMR